MYCLKQQIRYVQALYKLGGEGVGLQAGPEDSYGGCGGDVFRPTVPNTSSGDRKNSVADGRKSSAAGDQ